MTAFLPPNLLALFAPREPIPFLPPNDKLSHEKKRLSYLGVSQYLKEFEDPKDTPPPTRVETKEERQERKKREKQEQVAYKLEQDLALWDPHSNTHSTGDPFKSLFIARINYDTSESKLRREFEVYGSIRKIHIVEDTIKGKPRGYAFIEFEHERDMHCKLDCMLDRAGEMEQKHEHFFKPFIKFTAYKHADGKKIDSRRVLVDVERGRTVKGWRPRRLGGGLGGTRRGGAEENTRFSGRDDFPGAAGGREERRDRSRSREPRRRPSPVRERRRERSRSRERRRSPARRGRHTDPDADVTEIDEPPPAREKRRRRRSRSRDRGDRARRSRSTDRKRVKRSRSREMKQEKTEGEFYPGEEQFVPPPPPPPEEVAEEDIKVKMEPVMDEGYGQGGENAEVGGGDSGSAQQPTQNEYEEQYGDY